MCLREKRVFDFLALIEKYANTITRKCREIRLAETKKKKRKKKKKNQQAGPILYSVAITTDVLGCRSCRGILTDVSKVRRLGRCIDVVSAHLCPAVQIEVGYL